jgi:hypothetical protein
MWIVASPDPTTSSRRRIDPGGETAWLSLTKALLKSPPAPIVPERRNEEFAGSDRLSSPDML